MGRVSKSKAGTVNTPAYTIFINFHQELGDVYHSILLTKLMSRSPDFSEFEGNQISLRSRSSLSSALDNNNWLISNFSSAMLSDCSLDTSIKRVNNSRRACTRFLATSISVFVNSISISLFSFTKFSLFS